jgi:hypothetical protein
MVVDLVSKPKSHLISYALTSELIIQSYSVDSHMTIWYVRCRVCVCVRQQKSSCSRLTIDTRFVFTSRKLLKTVTYQLFKL